MIAAILKESRPKQWAKNVLVFAAPGAAGVVDNRSSLGRAVVAFVAFCLVSSGTYYWNDILDVEADRNHPKKRFRPIASGAIGLSVARVIGSAMLAAGIALGAATGRWQTVVVLAVYVALTLSYSAIWKHVAVLDLVAVASGFVLRAICGAVATRVVMSTWFVLCIMFGSLFIVTGKRYAELREMGDAAATTRASLEVYTVSYLRMLLSITVGATIVTYCTWAFDKAEISGGSFPFYELSIVPMVTALLRYLLILEQGHGGAPEEVFGADRQLQLMGLLWIVVFALGVYAA
jgi:decaprenyl-phosphate phosphoribosyltransferase